MNREKLADELTYHFIEPRPTPFWLWLGRTFARRYYLPGPMRVAEVDVEGLDGIAPLIEAGDGVLLTPNHPDEADPAVFLEVGRRAGRPFYFMAAYQVFQEHGRLARFGFPRIGAFPIDREGTDRKAFKTAVDILGEAKGPLVIFPEGEIYRTCDRLTPIREGAAAVATTGAKKAAGRGRKVWLVPAAVKYRFVDGHDPLPALGEAMGRLESRFTWWPRTGHALVDRIYAYAEGLLGLKEDEYFGGCRPGALKERIVGLRDAILDAIEDRRCGKRRADDVPVRVKELRRACLDRLADPSTTPEEKEILRHDLYDIFVAVQLFSYPGDYLRDAPSVERVAETLTKFEQDVLQESTPPRAPRRAIVRLGTPIDVNARLDAHPKARLAAVALNEELEASIQSLLDAIGPGRPLDPGSPRPPIAPRLRASPPDAAPVGQVQGGP